MIVGRWKWTVCESMHGRENPCCEIPAREAVSCSIPGSVAVRIQRGGQVVGGAGLAAIEGWSTQCSDILHHALAGNELQGLSERLGNFQLVLGQHRHRRQRNPEAEDELTHQIG